MELKQERGNLQYSATSLLIVPYGIETDFSVLVKPPRAILLIVPYGIETYQSYCIYAEAKDF